MLEQKHDRQIPHSTFAAYCKTIPELKEPPNSVPPEAENFLENFEVYQTLIQGIKATTDLAANLHGRMGILEDAAAERHKALVEALQQLAHGMPLDNSDRILSAIRAASQGIEQIDYRPQLNAIQEAQTHQGRDITAIRRSVGPVWSMVQRNAPWMKAFTVMGLFWAAVFGGLMWYYQLWRMLPLKAWRAALPF